VYLALDVSRSVGLHLVPNILTIGYARNQPHPLYVHRMTVHQRGVCCSGLVSLDFFFDFGPVPSVGISSRSSVATLSTLPSVYPVDNCKAAGSLCYPA